ncbi:MAG TPA: UGSC family (seleno)protein [Dehalococcoidales bacterium]|nr:UGSC family (seleno)protein [Dehalococcoidales bacterium]
MTAVAAGSLKLEKAYGIPVAPVSTHEFKRVAEADPRFSSVNIIYTPHPVIGLSPEALDKYIVGNDPNTGRPVIEEILDLLTKPAGEKKAASGVKPSEKSVASAELLGPDTEENLQRLFYERGWTDGLPIILPTQERVRKMLAGSCAAPDEIVCEAFKFDTREMVKYTATNIAINAVMAGARPEYFPVILAVAATKQPSFMPSTTPFEAMLLVNGPIRNEIEMNCGVGAFSAVNMANSVIGRAWSLMSISHGFAKLKTTLWSSQGNNHTYNNMCAGENEERSVWAPFHVGKGFRAEESVVSIFRGWSFLNSTGAASNRSILEELNIQLAVMPPLNSSATIIMDPLVARNLKENEGFSTKQDFCRYLSQNIKMRAGQFWKTDYIDMLVASQAYKGVEPFASWKKLPDDALIAPYHNPDNINIIVIGGETSPLWKAADYGYSVSAGIDKWRPKVAPEENCEDGSCGLPDPQIKYD